MTEQTKQLKAAMQLAEMHQAANPTDHNQATVERTTAEYEQALAEEETLADQQAEEEYKELSRTDTVLLQSTMILRQDEELKRVQLDLYNATLLNQQLVEKVQKIEEAQKSALSGETAPTPAATEPATIPAAPAATEPATTPAAPAAEGDVKKS